MIAGLPSQMDLGRYAIIESGAVRDLTNNEAIKLGNYVVRESLFDETNENIHDLLHTIAASLENNFENALPIIQKFNIEIKEFEKKLNDNKSHLRAIVANPHSLLDKDTQKVNIGRAKRISSRSYQHLAHHSEDWEKMSILSPKPRKILHEELIIELSVYENVLLKAFLHEAIKHLNMRVKETADISKFFLSIFGAKWICPDCNYKLEGVKPNNTCPNCNHEVEWINEIDTIWSEKIERRNALVGRAVKSDKSNDSSKTNRTLAALKSELVKLVHSPLFEEIPKHAIDSIVYHDTNVLNSHKHYKYLKILWLELKRLKEQAGEEDPFIIQQNIMNDMRFYVETLFIYSLIQMGYEISHEQSRYIALHTSLPTIEVNSDKYGVIHVSTNASNIRIVVLGGIYNLEKSKQLPTDTLCFCYCDYQKPRENVNGIYFVNPIDTNSIECSGQVIRRLIIREYSFLVNKKHSFSQVLRDYIDESAFAGVNFEMDSFTFSFDKSLPNLFNNKLIISNLKKNALYLSKNNKDQERLRDNMMGLVNDINKSIEQLEKILVCPCCNTPYRIHNLHYLVCDCGFVCDLDNERLYHHRKNDEYKMISKKGWGMDSIE